LLGRAGAKLERGWPPGLDLQAQFRTYQYLLFALLNASASDGQRAELRQRLQKDPNDIEAAATVGAHARWLGETGPDSRSGQSGRNTSRTMMCS